MKSLNGRKVLVVGGSSGIGLAAARHALAEGADVTIAGRSAEKLAAAKASLGGAVDARSLDTTDAAAVAAFFEALPAFDHIVVSAAATKSAPIKAFDLDDAYGSMLSKFWGAFHVARAAKIAPGGSLTLVSGFLSIRPKKGAVLQGAINAAVEALAKGLALELAPIRVNAVSPGFVDTPLWGTKTEAEHSALLERIAAGLPAGVAGTGDHIAIQIAAFMTNPYITGSVVYVDGGGALV
ncbi:SDR family oxidoreductase [Kaistia dalseonensis]|uniref:NAD(P)-dependent dehydrogenase (Short-subunit alcohol dehydrogenase family) n=1 Tax=Kaistia dalseonensis TaxID=410840 RepID=A0ABU0H5X3_9HYPH|nr:SDR family oxidoreductase [Kaistia dalseonensis]MCX5495121.1 SDR family oxidoreductase [Kaistia dalseonensis]MDQ0437703.1 NAD(P)-dependent dehydrogenase (short-subunit alcohol dehydrogenase family) [Kaistia dalseonensis]